MYTIARFLVDREHLDELHLIGEQMNVIQPGIYRGLRSRRDGMAVDVAQGGSWHDQSQHIILFVQKFREQIRSTRALGADVTIDIAVEPEDLGRIPLVLRQEPALTQVVGSEGIALEVSIYASGSR